MTISLSDLKDQAIADASSVPEAIQNLKAIDPSFAQQLEGKSALASKTLWFIPIVYGTAFLATKYGLNWDSATVNLVAGLLSAGVGWLMRLITSAPITSAV